MQTEALSKYTGVSVELLDNFMAMSSDEIIADEQYIDLLHQVDKSLLEDSLRDVRLAYEKQIPEFTAFLNERYALKHTPMFAYTLSNWVISALQFPEQLDKILRVHRGIPAEVFVGGLPKILDMVGNVPKGGAEWQKAICLLCIPLMRFE